MTGLRYHLVAALTALVTLGVGVTVGVGPLAERQLGHRDDRIADLRQDRARLAAELSAARDLAAGDRDLARTLAGPLVRDRLEGATVLLVAAPHADPALLRRTAKAVRTAGATVTERLSLTDVYVDPGKAQSPLEDLALRLVPPGVEFTDGATPIERVGTVLARSTVTDAETPPATADQDAAEVIAGLDELGAVQLRGEPGRLAQLAVLVAGPPARGSSQQVTGAREALLGLASALDTAARGVVVLGSGPTGAGSLVGQLRTVSGDASTVDTGGTVAGDVATVLALAEQVSGERGDYGRGAGADALLPTLSGAAPSG